MPFLKKSSIKMNLKKKRNKPQLKKLSKKPKDIERHLLLVKKEYKDKRKMELLH
jgi:hypothetical protein